MKRILVFLLFCMGVILLPSLTGRGWGVGLLFAQKGAPEGLMKEIRAKYAEAWQMVNEQLRDNETPNKNYMTATLRYVIPGCGQTNETLCYYYMLDDDNESGEMAYCLYLVTRKYNVAARQFYEEYLYDHKSSKALFVYKKYDSYVGDGTKPAEERYYLDNEQVVWRTVSENAESDSDTDARVQKECYAQRMGFTYIVNHSF
ncbi:MAG: hypothetical protein Q4E32_01890 [Bacteroidales bacterium]|nr:hypothetical protein [Bacteroidales bacterium]